MHIGCLLDRKFRVVDRLGSGSFSTVYRGREELTLKLVAIKTLDTATSALSIAKEVEAMQTCKEVSGVPRICSSGLVDETHYVVMELLGPDLLSLLNKQRKLPTPLVIQVAIQTLRTLKGIHSAGYLHLDIKPDNILIKQRKDQFQFYLIDFGLSKKYVYSGGHYPYCDRSEFRGNLVFASGNMLKHTSPSRRDDLESLVYTWAYLANGGLPWTTGDRSILKGNRTILARAKQAVNSAAICGALPPEFAEILSNVRNLAFAETPNYAYYANLLKLAQAEDFPIDPKSWGRLTASDCQGARPLNSHSFIDKAEDSPLVHQVTSAIRGITKRRLTKGIEQLTRMRSTKRHFVLVLNFKEQQDAELETVEIPVRTSSRKLTDKKEVAVTPHLRSKLRAMKFSEAAEIQQVVG